MPQVLQLIMLLAPFFLSATEVEVLSFNDEPEQVYQEETVSDLSSERWNMLFTDVGSISQALDQLRAKIDTLEKQQRDFLALITDLVIQPQKGMAFQEQHDYEESLDLMKVQQYPQALKLFNKFIEQYPQSDKVPYVYYWIAEIHSVQQNFHEARSCYQYLYEHYPRHAKASEALFKTGKIDYNGGLVSEAEALWSELITQYPQSQSAQLAKKSLKNLYEKNPSNISENN